MSTNLRLTPDQLNYAITAQWKRILRQSLDDLRVSIPAIVQSFDAVHQTVSVQIAIRELVQGTQGPQNIAIAPINNVPVCFPSGGGFSLTFPLKAGDEGLLIFCDACIDLWWARGGVQDQFERRRHDVTDCGFYPGGRSQPRVLSSYAAGSAQLRSDNGTMVVDIGANNAISLTAPTLNLTATGNVNINGQQVIIASTGNNTKIDGKTFLTHLHTGVASGNSNTGPVF